VKKRLEAKGLNVDAQIGCSGFRIDLAIRHPKYRDRYILGVECDGATYHSHRSARDRDRLRQEALEKLGWKIYRVWSTDWVKNPDKIVEDIFRKVQELIEEKGIPATGSANLKPEPSHKNVIESTREQSHSADQNDINFDKDILKANPYGFKIYEKYVEEIPAFPGVWKPHVFNLANLIKYIQEIVKKESPVHVNTVVRRIAVIYGFKKIGSRVRKFIEYVIWLAAIRGMFQKQGDFLWSGENVTPRIPKPGEPLRPIEEVAIEELMLAAETIVKKELGIKRESLIKTTARALGYDRTGAKVERRISEAIERLFKEGRFITYGDQVVLNPKAHENEGDAR
jgi:very-short-patch-repair endonuclease